MIAADRARPIRELLLKYDRPGPRYTSYPTALEFTGAFDEEAYAGRLRAAAARAADPLSLYLHIPFCESRCSFCGCVVIATRRRETAERYVQYLEQEIRMAGVRLGDRRRVLQYHWGGGTPTYLTPAQIRAVHGAVVGTFEVDPHGEAAIEIDPRVTTPEQIDLLRALGFNRLSLGVQDFSPEVQAAIHRNQGEAETRALFGRARLAGFESINIDLVYGLPRQDVAGFSRTIDAVVELGPDRIAAYSYAHVPWLRGNQKGIDAAELPGPELKFELFALAHERFLAAGYVQIGMDHFARPGDELARAVAAQALSRTFMGYTTRRAPDLIGFGVSAIGEIGGAFAQNTKKLAAYYAALDRGRFPIERGYVLDADDHLRRYVITELMCNFFLDRREVERRFGIAFGEYFARDLTRLTADNGPAADGLVEIDDARIEVPPAGRPFIRNICMAFDRYLHGGRPRPGLSRTI